MYSSSLLFGEKKKYLVTNGSLFERKIQVLIFDQFNGITQLMTINLPGQTLQ